MHFPKSFLSLFCAICTTLLTNNFSIMAVSDKDFLQGIADNIKANLSSFEGKIVNETFISLLSESDQDDDVLLDYLNGGLERFGVPAWDGRSFFKKGDCETGLSCELNSHANQASYAKNGQIKSLAIQFYVGQFGTKKEFATTWVPFSAMTLRWEKGRVTIEIKAWFRTKFCKAIAPNMAGIKKNNMATVPTTTVYDQMN